MGSCLLVGIWSYQVARRSLTQRIGQGLQRQAEMLTSSVDHLVYERYQNVQTWARDPIMLQILNPDHRQQVGEFFSIRQRLYKLYTDILCASAEGDILVATNPTRLGVNVARAPWFQAALASKGVAVYGLAQLEPAGEHGLLLAASILPSPSALTAQPLGVVVAVLNWSEVLNLVNTFPILGELGQDESAYAVLIGADGAALTQPYFESSTAMFTPNLKTAGLRAAALATTGHSGFVIEPDLSGATTLIGFAPSQGYREFKGLGWSALVFQRTREAFEPVATLSTQILIASLLVVGVVTLVIVVLAAKLTGPLRLLTHTAAAITQAGDLTKRVAVRSRDELGVLAAAFNTMVEELAQRQAQLSVARDSLEDIMRSMLNALIVVGEDASIQRVNPAMCRLLGYAAEELVGQPVSLVLTEGGPLVAGATHQAVEHAYRAKDGTRIPVLVSQSILRNQEGMTQGIIYAAQDLRERKQAEEALANYATALERSNKELDDFTYIVSHDLKEPLRSLDAFSRFLQEDYQEQLKDEGRQYLDRIRKNASRMQALIEDLLAVSRLSRRPNEFQRVAIGEVLEEVKQRFEYAMQQKPVEVVAVNELPTLLCDRVRMGEVFANLISNAIKYNDKPACRIEIGCRLIEGWYQFSVKDNGPGIEPQYFEKVFEIFQRLGKRDDQEGTGIGLTIVKKIVGLHKGKVWIESTPGQGTTFSFTIPQDERVLLGKPKLGELLVAKGLVTTQDVQQALQEQAQTEVGQEPEPREPR